MNNIPAIRDVIATPYEAKLSEQAETFGHEGILDGRFIKIGDLPLFAPLTDVEIFSKRSFEPEVRTPRHSDIARAALSDGTDPLCAEFLRERDRVVADNHTDKLVSAIFKKEAEKTKGPRLISPRDGVVDAGSFIYDSENKSLYVFDDSMEWGAANAAGRLITISRIQLSVGSDINVSADPKI